MAFVTGAPVSPDWEVVGTEFTQRCAQIAIVGPTSAGKTTLALTSKGPIGLLHASEKVAGVVEPFVRKGKLIRKFDFGFVADRKDEKKTAERAQVVWNKFENLYNDCMDKWGKTLIIDTEPDAWALRRLARFGTFTPKGNTMDLYNAVNFDWSQMFKNRPREQAEKRGVNLITIHTCSDEYEDYMGQTASGPKQMSRRTGRQKMDGQKSVKYWADVILWVERRLTDMQFEVRIVKGWFNGQIEGTALDDEMMRGLGYTVSPVTNSALTIPAILAMITDTPEKEWT